MEKVKAVVPDLQGCPEMSFDEFCGLYRLSWEKAPFAQFLAVAADGPNVRLAELEWCDLLAWYDLAHLPAPVAGKEDHDLKVR